MSKIHLKVNHHNQLFLCQTWLSNITFHNRQKRREMSLQEKKLFNKLTLNGKKLKLRKTQLSPKSMRLKRHTEVGCKPRGIKKLFYSKCRRKNWSNKSCRKKRKLVFKKKLCKKSSSFMPHLSLSRNLKIIAIHKKRPIKMYQM